MATSWMTVVLYIVITAATITCGYDGVPRKMKQLYKQYKRHGVQGDVNTVRYIPAHKGSKTSQSKLLFDLNSLHKQNETLIRAELHFYRRAVEAMSTIQIDTFEISSYYISLVERRRLSPATKGWQMMDITDTVKRCTNTIKTNNRLGIAFSDVNQEKVAVPVNMPQFLKHHGLPFILLYSHNTRTLEMDQIIDHEKSSPKAITSELNSMINPETGKPSISSLLHSDRKRRYISNNVIGIPSKVEPNIEDAYNEFTNKVEFERPNIPSVDEVTPSKVTEDATKDIKSQIQYIPWPKMRAKHKRVKSRSKKLPTPDTKKDREHLELTKSCGRKPLRINFEDIGWGSRIIEPRKIDAYYCSGACSFPHSLGNQLTNHATLQSLVTSIQHKSKVPQPCCVPQKLQSVTLMYYDEHKNIVLKTYADMSVESCVCR